MRKFNKCLLISVLLAGLVFAGCKNSVEDPYQGFGCIAVNSSRALNTDDITIAKIEVTGYGISEALTSSASLENGAGSCTVENIPAGKNRIVTVWGYDSSNVKLGTTLVRAICDIKGGETASVSVTQESTALANVFNSLLNENYDISSISTSDVTKIKSAIDSSKNWALIDSEQIASDYKSGSLKSASSYVLTAGSVTFTNNYSSVNIQVGDPVSSILNAFTSSSGTIENVAPGTWPVYVTADGNTTKTFVTVKAGEASNLGELGKAAVTDKIIVHVKDYTHIWAWNSSDSSENYTGGTWPGTAMTDSDGDGWYDFTIEKTSSNLIFSNSGNNQTSDLSLTAGEWWYKDGKWYESNPDDSEKPVLISFECSTSGTITGTTTFTISASDNLSLASAVLYLDDAVLTKVSLSGTSQTVSYIWDTSLVSNGSHTVSCIIQDAAGNSSSSLSLTLTTKNENVAPVAVISGTSRTVINSEKTYSAASSYDPNGTIASYKWSVTGATISGSSTDSTVKVVFGSSEGSATISLVVTDNEEKDSATVSKTVTISSKAESTDFRDETIYFLMTTRFYDGDESNNAYCWDDESCFNSVTLKDPGWRGDFKGLIEKLDYIKALGFSAIWITPVVENSSALDYHGYHASNFEKVDPRYAGVGEDPMDAYQKLIDACHEKGIKVIQDIVLNHTSNMGEHGFFRIFDTSNKTPGSDGVTPAVTEFSTDTSTGVFSDPLYGLTCLNNVMTGEKYSDYFNLPGAIQYEKIRLGAMKSDKYDTERAYHHETSIQWEGYTVQTGQMAGDCVDINTENHKVSEYIRNAYIKYIEMGVDAFRIDTVKHISRLTFNKEFLPYFKAAGQEMGKDFFMFGEGCVLRNEVWNDNKPPISVPFYTWKGSDDSYSWSETDPKTNEDTVYQHYNDNLNVSSQPTSNNAFLNGNTYHTPDRSNSSGLDMIDFYMHHKFGSAESAYSVSSEEDQYFNDATYNVTYVDSHDYGPNEGGYLYMRYSGGTQEWASNLNLMFTFRGIPCVYYGTEIEFQKNMQIEPYTNGNKVPYAKSGRAYYGDHLEGSVTASDFGEYTASGEVATTLSNDLAQHIIRLNKIRRAIPALRKGQYSKDGCSGNIAFKRRYTDSDVDSFVVVAINGSATFTGLPGGKYIDVVSGDVKTISEGGTITTDSVDRGNMRVYVNVSLDPSITGKIGTAGTYLK